MFFDKHKLINFLYLVFAILIIVTFCILSSLLFFVWDKIWEIFEMWINCIKSCKRVYKAIDFLQNDFAVSNLKRVQINEHAVLTYVQEAQVVRLKLNGRLLFVLTPVDALQHRAVGPLRMIVMLVVVLVLGSIGGSRWKTDFQLIFLAVRRCDAWFDLPPFVCCFVIFISHYAELWCTLMRLFCLPPYSLPVSCCDVTGDFWAFSRESAGEIFLGVLYLILDNCDSVDILQRLTPPSSSSQALTTGPWEYGTSPRSSRSLSWQATRTGWRQLRLTGAGNTWRQVRWRRLEACCAIFSRHFLECWACDLLRADCWFWCGWSWGRCDGGGDDVIVFDAVVSTVDSPSPVQIFSPLNFSVQNIL
jgi:hypothetical protein